MLLEPKKVQYLQTINNKDLINSSKKKKPSEKIEIDKKDLPQSIDLKDTSNKNDSIDINNNDKNEEESKVKISFEKNQFFSNANKTSQ